MKKENWLVIIAGVLVGVAALVLTKLGNPANMGFCIACFERDIAGAVGLHSAAKVQYVRPEIIGLVLGAFIMALAGKEFRPQAGSSPATRFVLGAFVMIGALVFLGCPLRMVLRMGGGDLNALVGLAGFVIGILTGMSQGHVAIVMPIVAGLMPGSLDLAGVAMVFGVAGQMITPTHVCLTITIDYFKSDFFKTLVPVILAEAIVLVVFSAWTWLTWTA